MEENFCSLMKVTIFSIMFNSVQQVLEKLALTMISRQLRKCQLTVMMTISVSCIPLVK